MKRYLLIAFILAGVVTCTSAQDRIITLNNDTIECRINRVTRSNIHFDVNTNGVITSGTIPLAGIISYSINPSGTGNRKTKPAVNGSFPRLRVALGGGAGYLFSSSEKAEASMVDWGLSEESAEAYYKDLRTGFYGSGDIAWMFTPVIGAGIRYKFFDTSANTEGFFDPQDEFYLIYATYSERIYVNFAGVSVLYSEPLGARERLRVNCSLSAGLALYRNEAELFQGNFLATGNSFGMDGAVGLEYHITPAVAVGAELSSFFSQLRKFEITDGSTTETLELEDDDIENLSRVELSLGIRFYLWNR